MKNVILTGTRSARTILHNRTRVLENIYQLLHFRMNHLAHLQKTAIDHAKNGEWQDAAATNAAIVEIDPTNISALNRLGFCYMQLSETAQAIEMYERVLAIEKLNSVAKKYLQMLQNNITLKAENINASEDFVEEPGKSKVIQLHRLAGNLVLERLMVAMRCELKCKGRYVTVSTKDGEYIGSLPEDISKHLSQLLKTGNVYETFIQSVSKNECAVMVKEVSRSAENLHTPSFFASKTQFDDSILLDVTEGDGMDDELPADDEAESDLHAPDEEVDEESKETIPPDVLGDVFEH